MVILRLIIYLDQELPYSEQGHSFMTCLSCEHILDKSQIQNYNIFLNACFSFFIATATSL